VTAATKTTSAGAPEKGAVSTPLAAKAPTTVGGDKTTTGTSGAKTVAGGGKATPSVRRSASVTAIQRQRQRQAQLEIQRRRQYITAGVVALLVVALAFGVFQLLPHSGPAAATKATAVACAVVPAGTPSVATSAPTVSGTPVTLSGGLQYIDIRQGCGATVAANATVTVNYTGWIQGGAMFDSSLNAGRTPFQTSLDPSAAQTVIPGWQQGIVGMKIGGVRRLIIPPALAYGAQGQGSIPPNATLVFDISLVSTP
jgi:FKBP-type peptidyl-prolyl cis-trans isomerase